MLKSILAPALCLGLMTAALPSALSAPAKDPGEAATVSKMFSGITQISFTRNGHGAQGHAYEFYVETVTFNLTGYTATRVVTAPPASIAQETGGGGMTWEPAGQFQGNVEWIDYQRLTALMASDKFFEGGNLYVGYVNGRSGVGYPMMPGITIRAVRNGTPKTVTMDATAPTQMWALQSALRGVASDIVWHKVEKAADAGGVKPR